MIDSSLYHDALKDRQQKYGLPELKKYPMPDREHVLSAIRFFNYVDPAYEKQLAKAILKRIREYGMSFDDFGVGEDNRFYKYLPEKTKEHLEHHGIKGQKWGIRRYQNADGTRTAAGRRHEKQLMKQDAKWAKKNYDKIYKDTYSKSRTELNDYLENDLNKRMNMKNADGRLSMNYVNAYNAKLAEVMNKNVGDIPAPSGKVVRYVAKRGAVGVHMALIDNNYFDLNSVKRGIYGDGRVAYKKDKINRV